MAAAGAIAPGARIVARIGTEPVVETLRQTIIIEQRPDAGLRDHGWLADDFAPLIHDV